MAKIEEIIKNKPVVCCATCHGEKPCPVEYRHICYMKTNTLLWWSEKHGYYPKLHAQWNYGFWVPPGEEGFITIREFSC